MVNCRAKDSVPVIFVNMEVRKSKKYIEALPSGAIDIVKKYDVLKKTNGCTKKTRHNYIRLLLQFAKEVGKPTDSH